MVGFFGLVVVVVDRVLRKKKGKQQLMDLGAAVEDFVLVFGRRKVEVPLLGDSDFDCGRRILLYRVRRKSIRRIIEGREWGISWWICYAEANKKRSTNAGRSEKKNEIGKNEVVIILFDD